MGNDRDSGTRSVRFYSGTGGVDIGLLQPNTVEIIPKTKIYEVISQPVTSVPDT